MDFVRWLERPTLRRPVLVGAFEGWNDAGDAASTACRYLATSFEARTFAEVDPEAFFDFTTTRPEVYLEGDQRRLKWPSTTLAAAPTPGGAHDMVFLQGVEPQLRWRSFCEGLIGVATSLGVEMAISLGGLLAEVAHTHPVKVTGTAADPELIARLGLSRSLYEGPTGIVGVLHDSLERAGVPTASLWASVPHYLAQSPSPKAALALVRRTADLLGAPVQPAELEIASAAYERQVDELVAEDDEAAAYVARLEVDGGDELDERSGEHLAAEVERFLRDHHRD